MLRDMAIRNSFRFSCSMRRSVTRFGAEPAESRFFSRVFVTETSIVRSSRTVPAWTFSSSCTAPERTKSLASIVCAELPPPALDLPRASTTSRLAGEQRNAPHLQQVEPDGIVDDGRARRIPAGPAPAWWARRLAARVVGVFGGVPHDGFRGSAALPAGNAGFRHRRTGRVGEGHARPVPTAGRRGGFDGRGGFSREDRGRRHAATGMTTAGVAPGRRGAAAASSGCNAAGRSAQDHRAPARIAMVGAPAGGDILRS